MFDMGIARTKGTPSAFGADRLPRFPVSRDGRRGTF